MKKNIYIFALSAVLGATAAIGSPQQTAAQPQQDQSVQTDGAHANRHQQHDPQQQVARLTKRLQLTNEQQSQLLPILSQQAEQAKAMRNDANLSATDRRAKMRELRQATNAQIKNILTDSQKQQYDAMLQQARDHSKRHGSGTRSAG